MQQGLGPGKPSEGQGQQTAALDHVERFRSQIESLTGRGRIHWAANPDNCRDKPDNSKDKLDNSKHKPDNSKHKPDSSKVGWTVGQRSGSWSSRGGPGAQIAQNGGGNQRGETRSLRIT